MSSLDCRLSSCPPFGSAERGVIDWVLACPQKDFSRPSTENCSKSTQYPCDIDKSSAIFRNASRTEQRPLMRLPNFDPSRNPFPPNHLPPAHFHPQLLQDAPLPAPRYHVKESSHRNVAEIRNQ